MTKQEYRNLMETYECLDEQQTYAEMHHLVDQIDTLQQVMKWRLLDMQRFLFEKGYDDETN